MGSALVLLVACQREVPAPRDSDSTEVAPEDVPTYWADVEPLVRRSCLDCHVEGGTGPFPLESYDDLYTVRELARTAVADRVMPPWFADTSCLDYNYDVSFTDEEIALFAKWVDKGALEGDAADRVDDVETFPDPDLGPSDKVIAMDEAYVPTEAIDDIRCFNFDWPEGAPTFVTALNLLPGNPAIMHHATVYQIAPAEVAKYRAFDEAGEGQGYSCDDEDRGTSILFGWLGGSTQSGYPEGAGVPIVPGSMIQLQVHYTVAESELGLASDQTAMEIWLDPEAEETELVVVRDPELNSSDLLLPAGESSVTRSAEIELQGAPAEFDIYGVTFHMHSLGTDGSVRILRADGTETCLLELRAWDSDFQSSYEITNPVLFRDGDKMVLECVWDNSAENQPIEDGVQRETTDVYWGPTLSDEMCQASMRIVGH